MVGANYAYYLCQYSQETEVILPPGGAPVFPDAVTRVVLASEPLSLMMRPIRDDLTVNEHSRYDP